MLVRHFGGWLIWHQKLKVWDFGNNLGSTMLTIST